ncbi:MAG: hypothetical protein IJH12_03330 [Clostridia bacterium]|nr:hypothetical protein [Clostridia bacterium]
MKKLTKKVLIIIVAVICVLFMVQTKSRAVNTTYDADVSIEGSMVTITFTLEDNITDDEASTFESQGWHANGAKTVQKDASGTLFGYAAHSELHEEGDEDYTIQYGIYAFPINVEVGGEVSGLESLNVQIEDTSIAEQNSEGKIVGKANGKTKYTLTSDGITFSADVVVGTGESDPPQDNPETPSQDDPETPSQDEPETPSQDEPETPSQDEPETPSQDEPETTKEPIEPEKKDNDSAGNANGGNSNSNSGVASKKDSTTANKVLSKTGDGFIVLLVIAGSVFVVIKARSKISKNN